MFNKAIKKVFDEQVLYSPVMQQKSFFPSLLSHIFTVQDLKSLTNVPPGIALGYYRAAAPVNLAINRIVEEFATIPPVIEDKKGSLQPNHPALDVLAIPNANTTQNKFFKALATFYEVTGDAFVLATGNISKPPLELFIVNPMQVTIEQSFSSPFPEKIMLSTDKGMLTFNRIEPLFTPTNRAAGRIRFVDDTGEREMWHFKDFSPIPNAITGLSQLTSLMIDIEQYLSASVHNDSVLKRGATISGIFSFTDSETIVSPKQTAEILAQIREFYSGAHNAGKAFLAKKLDFKPASQSNKDMDFSVLRQAVFDTIVIGLKVPLPLVSAETMTLNNLENAVLTLYDNAVIPLTKTLYEDLTMFLLSRYPNSEGLSITFRDSDLPALEPRRNAELNKVKNLNVLTINEIREMLGRLPIEEGGDIVFIPAMMVPASDGTDDQPDLPTDDEPLPDEDKPSGKKLVNALGPDGKLLLTDEMKKAYGKSNSSTTRSTK